MKEWRKSWDVPACKALLDSPAPGWSRGIFPGISPSAVSISMHLGTAWAGDSLLWSFPWIFAPALESFHSILSLCSDGFCDSWMLEIGWLCFLGPGLGCPRGLEGILTHSYFMFLPSKLQVCSEFLFLCSLVVHCSCCCSHCSPHPAPTLQGWLWKDQRAGLQILSGMQVSLGADLGCRSWGADRNAGFSGVQVLGCR